MYPHDKEWPQKGAVAQERRQAVDRHAGTIALCSLAERRILGH
jgi:hypothetical protein